MIPGTTKTLLLADDEDELNFCSTCSFSIACAERGYNKPRLRELRVLVEHIPPLQEGEHVFREGDKFDAILAIRTGAVKTYVTDLKGREQVLGFFLPGEIVGLNAISTSVYPCSAVALETVLLCRLSFPSIATLASRVPDLQEHLFRLLSEDICKASLLVGDYTADERLAGFLLVLSRRYADRGLSAARFRLPMARTDIANHLRLAPETVSRILKRLQRDGLIRVDRREVELLDPPGLEKIARDMLRN